MSSDLYHGDGQGPEHLACEERLRHWACPRLEKGWHQETPAEASQCQCRGSWEDQAKCFPVAPVGGWETGPKLKWEVQTGYEEKHFPHEWAPEEEQRPREVVVSIIGCFQSPKRRNNVKFLCKMTWLLYFFSLKVSYFVKWVGKLCVYWESTNS